MKAIDITALHKTYNNGHVALRGIDITIEQGDFFALLGPNGAGKSTIIGIICSLVNKTRGVVRVCGHDIDIDWRAAKRQIGVVPQEFNFSIFESLLDIVVNQAGYYGIPRHIAIERANEVLNELGLYEKRNVSAQRLSGGMKRRLMIARALAHAPKILILDEPTAGVDVEIRYTMWSFLRKLNQQGTTIILTTHYLEEAEQLCKHIAIIDKGMIREHTDMRTMLEKLKKQTFLFDCAQEIAHLPANDLGLTLLDTHTVQAELHNDDTLNAVFAFFMNHKFTVKSMRNKTNRLEELFIKLTTQEGE